MEAVSERARNDAVPNFRCAVTRENCYEFRYQLTSDCHVISSILDDRAGSSPILGSQICLLRPKDRSVPAARAVARLADGGTVAGCPRIPPFPPGWSVGHFVRSHSRWLRP